MPCGDGGVPYPEPRPTRAELTALLCTFCRYVETEHCDPSVNPRMWPVEVQAWWEAHQLQDAARESRERADHRAYEARLVAQRREIDAELAKIRGT